MDIPLETYNEALKKLNELAFREHAFSLQSDEDFECKENATEIRYKKKTLQDELQQMRENLNNDPKYSVSIDNLSRGK